MDADQLQVLKMLEEGRITADEAAKLLDALRPEPRPARSAPAGRFLRIRMTDLTTGRVQATVNLPLALAQAVARAGARVGARWLPQVAEFDLAALLRTVESGEPGRVVEWSEGETGRHFEVFVE
jgi:hypothetical protein